MDIAKATTTISTIGGTTSIRGATAAITTSIADKVTGAITAPGAIGKMACGPNGLAIFRTAASLHR